MHSKSEIIFSYFYSFGLVRSDQLIIGLSCHIPLITICHKLSMSRMKHFSQMWLKIQFLWIWLLIQTHSVTYVPQYLTVKLPQRLLNLTCGDMHWEMPTETLRLDTLILPWGNSSEGKSFKESLGVICANFNCLHDRFIFMFCGNELYTSYYFDDPSFP